MALEMGIIAQDDLELYSGLCPDTFVRELGVRPELFALGAVYDSQAAGILIVCAEGRTLRIEHIFTASLFRHLGIGTGLIDLIFNYCDASGAFDSVQCAFMPGIADTAEDGLCRFFANRGFTLGTSALKEYSLVLGELSGLPFWKKEHTLDASIIQFKDLPEYGEKMFIRHLQQDAAIPGYMPYSKESLLPELSFAAIEDAVIEGVAVLEEFDGEPELSFVYCRSQGKAPHLLPKLLRAVFKAACEHYSSETAIKIRAVNDASIRLVEASCPGAKFVQQVEAKADVAAYMSAGRVAGNLAELMDGEGYMWIQ